uniref:Uncharacterized protein n=1 Tax=Helianthus annuus TaxID=4232 RepID=A0A1Y3BX04_HELAN
MKMMRGCKSRLHKSYTHGIGLKNLEQQIKERDEKYSELDSKLNRLHKRAKKRIQEVQKLYGQVEDRFPLKENDARPSD